MNKLRFTCMDLSDSEPDYEPPSSSASDEFDTEAEADSVPITLSELFIEADQEQWQQQQQQQHPLGTSNPSSPSYAPASPVMVLPDPAGFKWSLPEEADMAPSTSASRPTLAVSESVLKAVPKLQFEEPAKASSIPPVRRYPLRTSEKYCPGYYSEKEIHDRLKKRFVSKRWVRLHH